jgi:hypothetical protein
MNIQGIISISGMSGLYKVVAQAKNGFIVESLADKKRQPISSSQRISAIEDISMYTNDEDIKLTEVLKNMKAMEAEVLALDIKKTDERTIRAFFKKVLPNFDEERVYTSDIKKVLSWYSLLKDLVVEQAEAATEGSEEKKTVVKAIKKEKAPTAAIAASKVKQESKKGAAAKSRKKV